MPKFVLSDRNPARLAGDFQIQPAEGYTFKEDSPEKRYIELVELILGDLATEEMEDSPTTDKAPSAIAVARSKKRADAVSTLRAQAESLCKGDLSLEHASFNAPVIKGIYVGERNRLSESLFVVRAECNPNGFAVDLLVTVRDVGSPSQDKQALFVAISNVCTVIRTVSQRIRDRANNILKRLFRSSHSSSQRALADRILDQYIRKLAETGRLGLEGPHTELANLALEGIKNEFVAEEAGHIKNAYLRRLGVASSVFASLSFGLYVLVDAGVPGVLRVPGVLQFLSTYQPFLLAAGGASVGTWLSFSIRRVTLSFEDLANLEQDLLDPSIRVIFVIALTITVCLLFWTGAINIEIGNLKTSQLSGPTGIVVGIFCGLAERALATAISGRAVAFAKGISTGA